MINHTIVGKKNCQGFALISAVFTTLMVSAMTLSLASFMSVGSSGSVDDLQSQQAAYVADGGLHYILMKELKNSTDFTSAAADSNVALGQGQFSVSYANRTTTSADVTVTAQVGNSVCQVQQHVVKQSGAGGALSGATLSLSSSQGGGGEIVGPISYTSGFSADAGYEFSATASQGSAPAAVSMTPYVALTTSTITGDYTVPDGFNGYVHVTGNATINGNTTMTGMVVADGDISVNANGQTVTINGTLAAGGNITTDFKTSAVATLTAQSVGGQMQPALVAVGNISMAQKQDTIVTLSGLIRAGGNVSVSIKQDTQLIILGAVMANGNVSVDSKQDSDLTLDFSAGGPFLSGNNLLLTQWKKI